MNDNKWFKFTLDGWKPHFVPFSLLDNLKLDAEERHPRASYDIQEVHQAFIDVPGMAMIDRTHQEIDLDGLKISMATTDFEYAYHRVNKELPREFASSFKYFKLHFPYVCFVITSSQYLNLKTQMTAMLDEVKVKAQAEHEEFMRRIDKINSDGVKVISSKAPNSYKDLVVPSQPSNNEKN